MARQVFSAAALLLLCATAWAGRFKPGGMHKDIAYSTDKGVQIGGSGDWIRDLFTKGSFLQYHMFARPIDQVNRNRKFQDAEVYLTDKWTGIQVKGEADHGSQAFAEAKEKLYQELTNRGHMAIGYAHVYRNTRTVVAWCCARNYHRALGAFLWYKAHPGAEVYTVVETRWADQHSEDGVIAACGSGNHHVFFRDIPHNIPLDALQVTCVGANGDPLDDPITPTLLDPARGQRTASD